MKPKDYPLYGAAGLYVLSLALPGIIYQGGVSSDFGFVLLLQGWLGIFIGQFAWYANVLALLSFKAIRNNKPVRGSFFALTAFILGLQSFLFLQKPLDEGVSSWHNVDHLGIGFYVWELSFLVLFVCGIRTAIQLQQAKKLFFTLLISCTLLAGSIYLLFPLTKPSDDLFERISYIAEKVCIEKNVPLRMQYGKPSCGTTSIPAPYGWFYKTISGGNSGEFVIEMRNLYGDSIVCTEKACPSSKSKTHFFTIINHLDTFPVTTSSWKDRFLGDKNIPIDSYRVFYFYSDAPLVAIKEATVESIVVDETWAGDDYFRPRSDQSLGVYWIGSFSTEQSKNMVLSTQVDASGEVRVILDGHVLHEAKTDVKKSVLVPAGNHVLEVEYTSDWSIPGFSATLTAE